VESLLLYIVVIAAFGLMLAGAYGAAPMLFARRQEHAHGGNGVASRLFALGAAFPLLEQDLSATRPDLRSGVAPATTADAAEADWFGEQSEDIYNDASAPDSPMTSEPLEEELLNDLFAEIGMLRIQIEGLRRELGGLKAQTAAIMAPDTESAVESRRRYRSSAVADLPVSLRRRLSDVRRERRAGRPA